MRGLAWAWVFVSCWCASAQAQEQLDLPLRAVPRSLPSAELRKQAVPEMARLASQATSRLEVPGLTVAGGVSLGAYGAGFLYYYTLARHDRAGGVPFSVVTGASAGSINSVLAALAMCTKPRYSPEQNLFFDTWIPVGMERHGDMPGLRDPAKVTSRSLFSRAPIEYTADRILKKQFEAIADWTEGGCDTLLGLVSTQLVPARVPLQHVPITPTASRQSQRFLVRLKRDPEKAPVLYPDVREVAPGLTDLFPVLGHPARVDVDHPEPISFDLLAGLLKASSSFPFAFEPYRLPLTVFDATRGTWTQGCEDTNAPTCVDPEFIDGGIYENVPLHFAQRVQAWRGIARGNIVVDTEATPWRRPEKPSRANTDLLSFVSGLVGSVLASTLAAELFSTFENEPELRGSDSPVAFTVRQLPTASGHFANFLGFFDRDFRVFDFYLGMLDALSFVGADNAVRVPAQYSEQWRVLQCFESWQRASSGFAAFPKREDIAACTALRVGSWDRERARWTNQGVVDRSTAAQRSRYNMVRLLAAAQHFRRHEEALPNEGLIGEVDHWFALMEAQGMRLEDVSERELANVRALVRDQLVDLLEILASKQEGKARVPLSVGIRVLANTLDYREPKWHLALGLHALRGFEAGTGFSRGHFRVEGNFRLSNVDFRSPRRYGADLRLGPRLVWAAGRRTWGALAQLEPFAGVGYYATFHRDGNSMGLKPELGTYFVLLQRFYLSLAAELRWRAHQEASYDRLEYGDSRVSWGVFGSIGWRFLWGTARHRL